MADDGTGVALEERPFMFNLTEAVEKVDVEKDDEEFDRDGLTVVQPLMSLAFESARGFAGLNEERALVDDVLAIDKRVRVEDSEGAGISEPRVSEFLPERNGGTGYLPGYLEC